jgi:hypothetical protein
MAVSLTSLLYLAAVLYLRLVRVPAFIAKRVAGMRKSHSISVLGE